MALTESQRLDLYERLKQSSLGEEGAHIVMNAIPIIDWTDLATHNDLALLRTDLRSEMTGLRSEFRGEMNELRSDLRLEMAELRAELRADMSELRTDFQVEMRAMETRLQRSLITWILAAQGVTLATLGVLAAVLTLVVT